MKFKLVSFAFIFIFAISSIGSARHHHKKKSHHPKVCHHVHHYYPPVIFVEPTPIFFEPEPIYVVRRSPWGPRRYVLHEYIEPVWPYYEQFNVFFSL